MASASVKKITIKWTTMAGEERTAERYKARYRDTDGHEHAKLFRLKRDADSWLAEEISALTRGDWVNPNDKKTTVEKYAAEWQRIQVSSDGTSRIVDNALRLHIVPALGHHKLGTVRPSHIQAFVKKLEGKELAPGSIRNIYDVAAAVFSAAVHDRMIPTTPCRRIRLPKNDGREVAIPTVEDVGKVREALNGRWKAIVVLLAGSGLRAGELLGLRQEDVDFLRRTIRVERQRTQANEVKPLKSKASRRTIPVGQVVIDALADHLAAYPASDDALLLDEWGRPLTYRRWKQLLRDAAKETKVDVTSHGFRHFAASALISGGASVKQVQTFLGHSSAVITLRTYAHLFPGDEDRTRSVLDAALSPLADLADSGRTVAVSE